MKPSFRPAAYVAALVVAATSTGHAAPDAGAAPSTAPPAPGHHWAPEAQVLEPKAIEILKTASKRLAGARTLAFTAIIADESPSRLGPPLLYASRADVTLQRPDHMRILNGGPGPRTEIYLAGTQLAAWAPTEGLIARATVPPTIDGAFEAGYKLAHVYFPFADLVVDDPYGVIAPDLRLAFYIGRSEAVGGVVTDMLAYATDEVFIQAWIGVDDKLPRRLRAIYLMDGGNLRHEMELSGWKVDPKLPAGTFTLPAAAAKAKPVPFERPGPQPPPPLPAAPARVTVPKK